MTEREMKDGKRRERMEQSKLLSTSYQRQQEDGNVLSSVRRAARGRHETPATAAIRNSVRERQLSTGVLCDLKRKRRRVSVIICINFISPQGSKHWQAFIDIRLRRGIATPLALVG